MTTPADLIVPKFFFTQHDTARPLVGYCEDVYGKAQDLTGATVTFSMATKTRVPESKIDEQECVVLDAIAGKVQYNWADDDVDTSGEFIGQFKVTLPNTKALSFPSAPKPYDYITIIFQPDI